MFLSIPLQVCILFFAVKYLSFILSVVCQIRERETEIQLRHLSTHLSLLPASVTSSYPHLPRRGHFLLQFSFIVSVEMPHVFQESLLSLSPSPPFLYLSLSLPLALSLSLSSFSSLSLILLPPPHYLSVSASLIIPGNKIKSGQERHGEEGIAKAATE